MLNRKLSNLGLLAFATLVLSSSPAFAETAGLTWRLDGCGPLIKAPNKQLGCYCGFSGYDANGKLKMSAQDFVLLSDVKRHRGACRKRS